MNWLHFWLNWAYFQSINTQLHIITGTLAPNSRCFDKFGNHWDTLLCDCQSAIQELWGLEVLELDSLDEYEVVLDVICGQAN